MIIQTIKRMYSKMKKSNPANVFHLLQNEEYGKLRVVTDSKKEGYFCLADLCDLLDVSVSIAIHKIPKEYMNTFTVKGSNGSSIPMFFVTEEGLYLIFLLSESEEALHIQEWLNETFLDALHKEQMMLVGMGKNAKMFDERYCERLAMSYIATAANVLSSGHFKIRKEVPELTKNHLIGWWHNPNDTTAFMLQFDSKTEHYWCRNIRMNVTLTKKEDGSTDECYMVVNLLDLDDPSNPLSCISTEITEEMLFDGGVLDNIMWYSFNGMSVLDHENIDIVCMLNGTVSFRRSRRV